MESEHVDVCNLLLETPHKTKITLKQMHSSTSFSKQKRSAQSELMETLKSIVGEGNNESITQRKMKHMDSMSAAAHGKPALEEERMIMERAKAQ